MTEAAINNIVLSIPLLLLVAVFLGELFERLKLESVIGYILAGLLLGPSFLKIISPESVGDFAIIGVILIMFIAGLKEEDVGGIFKRKDTLSLGILVLVFTFIVMFAFLNSPLINILNIHQFTPFQSVFIALSYSIVSLGVPVKLMLSKKMLGSKIGLTILNIMVANLIVGLGIMTLITSLVATSFKLVALKFLGTLIFVAIFIFLFKYISKVARKITLFRVEEAQFTLSIILILLMAYSTNILGFSNVLGAFLAGAILSRTRFSETRAFMDRFKAISLGFFVPIFFGWIGLELNLFGSEGIIANLNASLAFFIIAILAKFIIAYSYAKITKMKSPGMIGSSLLSLDAASLVIIFLAIEIGIFESSILLSIFAPSILFSTVVLVLLFKLFWKREQTSKANS